MTERYLNSFKRLKTYRTPTCFGSDTWRMVISLYSVLSDPLSHPRQGSRFVVSDTVAVICIGQKLQVYVSMMVPSAPSNTWIYHDVTLFVVGFYLVEFAPTLAGLRPQGSVLRGRRGREWRHRLETSLGASVIQLGHGRHGSIYHLVVSK